MMTAKVFENGRSQAVRLPKDFRFTENEVAINMVGSVVMLMPKSDLWAGFLSSLDMFSDDFMSEGRSENNIQEREAL